MQSTEKRARVLKSHGHCRTCGKIDELNNGLCSSTCFPRRKRMGRDEFAQYWDSHLKYIEDEVLQIWIEPQKPAPKGRQRRGRDS